MTAETLPAVRVTEPTLTAFEVIERVITKGDLAQMTPQERVAFYWKTCESLGLNPLTRPFEFHNLNGKLVMYAKKDATDQLRKINAVSITEIRRDKDADLGLLTVYARGRDRSGREDEATGVVSIKGLSGEALANATMKAETKAKRRLTLSLVGLGFLDESEIDGATADVDPTTGELTERAKPKSLLESVQAQQAALAASDGQGAAEAAAPVPEPAPAGTVAPAAAEPAEGEVRAVAGEIVEGMTQAQLFAGLDEAQISREYANARAKELWPDRPPRTALTPEQRAALLADLTTTAAL